MSAAVTISICPRVAKFIVELADADKALVCQLSGEDESHESFYKLSEFFWKLARMQSGLFPGDLSPEAEERVRVFLAYKRALWKLVKEKKVICAPGELVGQAVIQDFFLGVQAICIE